MSPVAQSLHLSLDCPPLFPLCLLACSVVEEGGLDCCRYAGALCASFGPGFGGYRGVYVCECVLLGLAIPINSL